MIIQPLANQGTPDNWPIKDRLFAVDHRNSYHDGPEQLRENRPTAAVNNLQDENTTDKAGLTQNTT